MKKWKRSLSLTIGCSRHRLSKVAGAHQVDKEVMLAKVLLARVRAQSALAIMDPLVLKTALPVTMTLVNKP